MLAARYGAVTWVPSFTLLADNSLLIKSYQVLAPVDQTNLARDGAKVGEQLFVQYNPAANPMVDPPAASITWLQFVQTNVAPFGTVAEGTVPGAGTVGIDNPRNLTTPFWLPLSGYSADGTGLADFPNRRTQNALISWQADLFPVVTTVGGGGAVTATIWPGIHWGWQTIAAPPPAPGGGLNNVVPNAQFANLGQNTVFSSMYANPISVIDAAAGTNPIQVTLTATNGTVSLNSISGLSFSFSDANGTGYGSGTNDTTITFRGTVTDSNNALDGMVFTPSTAGSGSVEITSNDLGNNSGGTPETADNTVDITVADAPLNSVPGHQTTDDGTDITFSTANSNAISVSYTAATSGESIEETLNAVNGTISLYGTTGLTFSVGTGAADTTMTFEGTQTDINAALDGLVFSPTTFGMASIEIISNDLGQNAESTPQIADNSVPITVVSNGPLNRYPSAQTMLEGTTLVFSRTTGNPISVKDPEAGTNTIQVALTATDGNLSLSSTVGLSFSYSDANGTGSGTGTSDASMEFRGTAAAINAALEGMVFTPSAYGSGSVEIVSNDLGYNDLSTPATADNTVDIAVTDGPEATVPAMQTLNTNSSLVLSSGNGNAVSLTDPGAGSNTIQVELDASYGDLTLSATTGLSFVFSDSNGTGSGSGSADATMVFRGTLTDINTALDGLTFTPTTDYSGFAPFAILTNDLGNNLASTPQTNFAMAGIYVNQCLWMSCQAARPSMRTRR